MVKNTGERFAKVIETPMGRYLKLSKRVRIDTAPTADRSTISKSTLGDGTKKSPKRRQSRKSSAVRFP